MALPVDRSTSNTAAEHVDDHNTLHGQHNDLEGHAADPLAHGTYAPVEAAEIAGGTVVQTVLQPPQVTIAAWKEANNGHYVRCASRGTINAVRCASRGTINAVRFRVGTASGNISVAAYRADGANGRPSTRLATSGAVATPAGDAVVALDASVTLEVGDWLYLSCDNTTASFFMLSSTGGVGDTSLAEGIAYRAGAGHPAPSPAGSLGPGVFGVPWLTGVTV